MHMSAVNSSDHTPRCAQLGEKVEVLKGENDIGSEGEDEQWYPATVASPPKSGSSLRVRLHGDDEASECACVSSNTTTQASSLAAPQDRAVRLTRSLTPAGRSVPRTGSGREARSTARRL